MTIFAGCGKQNDFDNKNREQAFSKFAACSLNRIRERMKKMTFNDVLRAAFWIASAAFPFWTQHFPLGQHS